MGLMLELKVAGTLCCFASSAACTVLETNARSNTGSCNAGGATEAVAKLVYTDDRLYCVEKLTMSFDKRLYLLDSAATPP
jgi:hypothetical protein